MSDDTIASVLGATLAVTLFIYAYGIFRLCWWIVSYLTGTE